MTTQAQVIYLFRYAVHSVDTRMRSAVLQNHDEHYDAFMLDHAAGNQSSAMALAGDLHVWLSADGLDTSAVWAAIGGALLERATDGDFSARMDSIEPRGTAPVSVKAVMDMEYDTLKWRRGLSGVRYADAGVKNGQFMSLMPGQSAPAHSHSALEATIVLSGRFTDGHGEYKRGDIVIGAPGVRHKPAAVGDTRCVCYVAREPTPFWRLT